MLRSDKRAPAQQQAPQQPWTWMWCLARRRQTPPQPRSAQVPVDTTCSRTVAMQLASRHVQFLHDPR